MILFLICLPLFSSLILYIIPSTNINRIKQISLFLAAVIFYISITSWISYQSVNFKFQFFITTNWFFNSNWFINFGIDNLSLFFVILTTFLFVLCFLYNWLNIKIYIKEYFILLFLIEFFLLLIFVSLDLFLFYFFFESILIPMFMLIGIWGSKAKKIKAAYLFFFYTLFGSICFLLAIIYIYYTYGITTYPYLTWIQFTKTEQLFLWFAFFLSFASKIPMIPFHIWLPEAHVEAPTTGSIILAGILLKLGIYGFLRFLIPLFPYANNYFLPFILSLSVCGILYSALTALRQIDLKKIIAYSSISHMNLVIFGLFSFSALGIQGSILQSLSHGFVSSGLFFSIGFLYDRYHSRILTYYSGLTQLMPLFSIYLLFFIFSNIAIPGTSNFTGEFLILLSLFKINKLCTFLGALGIILGGIYSLNLVNKLLYGNLKLNYISHYTDLTEREFFICNILVINILILGLFPSFILNSLFNIL